jgi:hypothetical protein
MQKNALVRSISMIAATVAASMLSSNAPTATTVYAQAPAAQPVHSNYGAQFFLGAGSYVYNDPNDPGFNWSADTDTQSWETFSLATPASVNRIGWYGNNADGDFAVDLFTITCFSCNVALVNGNGGFTHTSVNPGNGPTLLPTTVFTQAAVHKTFVSSSGGPSSLDLYSYYIDLGASVTLPAATGMNG